MIKCIHNLNFGFEATFGNDINDFMGYHPITCTSNYNDKTDDPKHPVRKIGFRMMVDSNTVECASVKGKFQTNKLNQFYNKYNELSQYLFSNHNLKPSSDYPEIENEGGGHIHISTKEIIKKGPKFHKAFLRNLYNFTINNPELNWLFNGPWDNYNGNSLLGFVYSRYEELFISPYQTKFRIKKHNYEYAIENYSEVNLDKSHPIIYRRYYKTIEFRLFMMPRTQQELQLHFDLCFAIYNYIWKTTIAKKTIELKYKKVSELKKITKKQAIQNSNETFRLLGMEKHIKLIEELKYPFLDIRYQYPNDLLV